MPTISGYVDPIHKINMPVVSIVLKSLLLSIYNLWASYELLLCFIVYLFSYVWCIAVYEFCSYLGQLSLI